MAANMSGQVDHKTGLCVYYLSVIRRGLPPFSWPQSRFAGIADKIEENPMEPDLLKLDRRIIVVSGAAGGRIGTTVTRTAARAGAARLAGSRSHARLRRHLAPLLS